MNRGDGVVLALLLALFVGGQIATDLGWLHPWRLVHLSPP